MDGNIYQYPTYKHIDNLERFMADLFKLSDINEALTNNIIEPMIKRSIEYCNLVNNKIITAEVIGQGGYGMVATLKIKEDLDGQPLKGMILSLKPCGGFEPFYIDLIAKVNTSPMGAEFKKSIYGDWVTVSDPIAESIFGQMLGHLYDMGICPFYNKFIGLYGCPNKQNSYNFSIITEKNDINMYELYSRERPYNNVLVQKPHILYNILFQFIYATYIAKYYYGITHHDTHMKNIMFKYINNKSINLTGMRQSEYIYQGVNISEKDYFLIKVPGKIEKNSYVVIKNIGLLLKVIDYGLATSFMKKSKVDKYKSYGFDIGGDDNSMRGPDELQQSLKNIVTDNTKYITKDIQFLMSNIYLYMIYGLDRHAYEKAADYNETKFNQSKSDYGNLIKSLDEFSSMFYGATKATTSEILKSGGNTGIPQGNDGLIKPFFTKRNSAGIRNSDFDQMKKQNPNANDFSEPENLISGLINICSFLGHVTQKMSRRCGEKEKKIKIYYLEDEIVNVNYFDENNSIVLSEEITKTIKNNNNLEKFLDINDKTKEECAGEGFEKPACKKLMDKRNNYDPNNLLEKPLISRLVNTKFYNNSTRRFNIINVEDLGKEFMKVNNDLFKIYTLQINPGGLRMDKNEKGSLVYRDYQSWLNYQFINPNWRDNYIENVNVNILKVGNKSMSHLNYAKSLWNVKNDLSNKKNGFVVNGGYFIVKGNINKLTDHLINEDDLYKPIGFSYDKNHVDKSGTYLPVPEAYREHFGVVYMIEGVTKIMKYDEFINLHSTVDIVSKKVLEDGSIVSFNQKVIAMTGDSEYNPTTNIRFEKKGTPILSDKELAKYDYAFCTGPALIREGEVVFDNDVMLQNSLETDDGLKYAVIPGAGSNKMFRSTKGEGNMVYGMRHSDRFMVHNVIAVDQNDNLLFFLIEGRGYDAPGLDRVQVAKLVSKFNIKNAYSLDGGFSANVVYKDENEFKYLIRDPEKRKLGVSMTFSE